MRIGYARVSKREQNLDMQIHDLKQAGCEKIFKEKITSVKDKKPKWELALSHLREGDTLVVWKMDRMARSVKHLIEISEDMKARKVELILLKDGIALNDTAVGKLMYHILAALAQFERDLTIERTISGLRAARRRGKKGGRKPGLSPAAQEKAKKIKKLYDSELFSIDEICSTVGCARATLYKYKAWEERRLKREGSKKPSEVA